MQWHMWASLSRSQHKTRSLRSPYVSSSIGDIGALHALTSKMSIEATLPGRSLSRELAILWHHLYHDGLPAFLTSLASQWSPWTCSPISNGVTTGVSNRVRNCSNTCGSCVGNATEPCIGPLNLYTPPTLIAHLWLFSRTRRYSV